MTECLIQWTVKQDWTFVSWVWCYHLICLRLKSLTSGGLDMQISTGSSGINNFKIKLYKSIKHVWLAKLHQLCNPSAKWITKWNIAVVLCGCTSILSMKWWNVDEVGYNTVDDGYVIDSCCHKNVSNVWSIETIWNREQRRLFSDCSTTAGL